MKVSIRKRKGLSEVIGTVLVAAMTIVAGAAIFGYVNGQAGTASQAYGQAVGNSINYLNEKFTVVEMSIANVTCGTSSCGSFTLWIYNTGVITLSVFQVRLYSPSTPSAWHFDLLFNYSAHSGVTTNQVHDIAAGAAGCTITVTSSNYESPVFFGTGAFSAATSSIARVQLTVPPTSSTPSGASCPSFGQLAHSDTYYATVVGLYGNSYTYSQVG